MANLNRPGVCRRLYSCEDWTMVRPTKLSPEMKERAFRLVLDHGEYGSRYAPLARR